MPYRGELGVSEEQVDARLVPVTRGGMQRCVPVRIRAVSGVWVGCPAQLQQELHNL